MCGLYLEGLKLEVVFCLQVDGPITPGGGGLLIGGGLRYVARKISDVFTFLPSG